MVPRQWHASALYHSGCVRRGAAYGSNGGALMPSPYVFDKALADAAVEFFPRLLRFSEGEWAGKPFRLADWQAHHTRQIFGWRRRKDGTRRYRRVRGGVGRENGKAQWFVVLGRVTLRGA